MLFPLWVISLILGLRWSQLLRCWFSFVLLAYNFLLISTQKKREGKKNRINNLRGHIPVRVPLSVARWDEERRRGKLPSSFILALKGNSNRSFRNMAGGRKILLQISSQLVVPKCFAMLLKRFLECLLCNISLRLTLRTV